MKPKNEIVTVVSEAENGDLKKVTIYDGDFIISEGPHSKTDPDEIDEDLENSVQFSYFERNGEKVFEIEGIVISDTVKKLLIDFINQ